MKKIVLFLFSVLTFVMLSVCAFADAPTFAGLPVLSQVGAAIASVVSSPYYTIITGFVIEAVLRLWPTSKPYSILIFIDALIQKAGSYISMAGVIIGQVGGVFAALDKALNGLIPQNTQPPASS